MLTYGRCQWGLAKKRQWLVFHFCLETKPFSRTKCPVSWFYLLRSPFCVRFFSFSFLSCLASLSFSRCILSPSFFFWASSRACSRFCFCLLSTSSTLVFLNRADTFSKGQLDESKSTLLIYHYYILPLWSCNW